MYVKVAGQESQFGVKHDVITLYIVVNIQIYSHFLIYLSLYYFSDIFSPAII